MNDKENMQYDENSNHWFTKDRSETSSNRLNVKSLKEGILVENLALGVNVYNNKDNQNIFYYINKLPFFIVNEIKKYISEDKLIFVNREKYTDLHYLIRYKIPSIKFENYIRTIVYRDFDFVFQQIVITSSHYRF